MVQSSTMRTIFAIQDMDMSRRAILLGVLGAITMAGWAQYVNKYVPGVHGLIRGHLPVSVFGAVILFALCANPVMGYLRAQWRLRPREIAVILACTLIGCGIADAGLMRHFPRILIYPIVQNQKYPGWQHAGVLQETPPFLLVNDGQYDERVVEDYVTPMGEPGRPIAITQVPWWAWRKPLTIWTTLIALIFLGVISLSVLVHRQWAERERIRYPLAEMTRTLLEEDDAGRNIIIRNRRFWLGAGVLLFIHLVNGVHLWFPHSISIPLQLDFSPLQTRFPEFAKIPGAAYLMAPTIFPACVGFTFFLASEIGFSLGISNLLHVIVLYWLVRLGVETSGSIMTGGVILWESFGSFLAMGILLLYMGRRYYGIALREAVTFRRHPESDPTAVWAWRAFLVTSAGSMILLTRVGMDPLVAVLTVALTFLLFLICARLNVECGTFFFAPSWQVPGVLAGLFGLTVLGPQNVILLGLAMHTLSIDSFECLMPYAVNGLKIAADARVPVGRTGLTLAAVLLVGMAVAIPIAVWADYNHAANLTRGWDSTSIYNTAERVVTELRRSAEWDTVRRYGMVDRLRNARPAKSFFVAAGVGFGLLFVTSFLRLRLPWWPLHPVAILVFGSSAIGRFGFSFLLGWLLKASLTRLGGGARYTRFKPLMIGVIVGDLTGAFFVMLSSWMYYSITGVAGPSWHPW